MNTKSVTLFVYPVTDELDPEDESLPGEYEVYFDKEIDESELVGAALDIFHDNFGVNTPDDFAFYVLKDGVILDEPADYENDSHTDSGYIEKISDDVGLIDAIFEKHKLSNAVSPSDQNDQPESDTPGLGI